MARERLPSFPRSWPTTRPTTPCCTAASITFPIKTSTNTLKIAAVTPGTEFNNVAVRFEDVGTGTDSVEFRRTEGSAGTLIFRIHPASTTAAQVRDLLNNDSVANKF